MAEGSRHEERSSERDARTEQGASADELEQRQRPDGVLEEPGMVQDESDEPLTPDMIEQRQRADGTIERQTTVDESSDEPLTADMIEQRQSIEDDESDDQRSE